MLEMDGSMAGHLDTERISALLDEPLSDRDGQAHLETCGDCQTEFERMSRVRMALSALPGEDPPRGHWIAIEAALDAAEFERDRGVVPMGRRVARRFMVSGPLQAAAGLVLFAGGVLAGLELTAADPGPVSSASVPAVVSTSGDDRVLLDGLTQLETLRTPLMRQVGVGGEGSGLDDDGFWAAGRDPMEAAQSLAQVDGLIRALREHLDANPRDFFASAYLLDLQETRHRLTDQLGRASGTRTW